MIANAVEGKPLPVYGDGMNVRDWLHVEDHCSALTVALEKATGKKVQVRVQVDPSVIGGVLVKVGDQIVDGTVRTQLNRFREGLRSA